MRTITQNEFLLNKEKFVSKLENGELFVYPTDTIYGMGCDATNETAVLKLRNSKRQHGRPLSVIAPSIKWIKENCYVNGKSEEWLAKLPGPYTLVFKLKNKNSVARSVTETGSIGIRIPAHHISEFAELTNKPIITTSANVSGKMFITNLKELDPKLKKRIGFFVDAGEVTGSPSTIVLLDKEEIEIMER